MKRTCPASMPCSRISPGPCARKTTWKAMIREELKIQGLDQFGASSLVILGQIRTGPGQHWAVRREFYGRVKARFEAEGIEIPYTYLPPAPPRLAPPVPEEATEIK